MEAGRSLDALIAEKVMGLELWHEQDPRWECRAFRAPVLLPGQVAKPCAPPHYSTSIEAAWEVVEKLKDIYEKDGHWFSIEHTGSNWDCGWRDGQADRDDPGFHLIVSAPTAPHAICLAALKAVGHIQD